MYKEVYKLLTKRLGLLSQTEKVKKKKAFTDLEDKIKDSRKSWFDIKKKNMKELLIELYVSRMKNKYSLSVKQAKNLLSIILFSLIFKVIKVDDIDYSNGQINSIKGINFSKKQVLIEHDLYNIEVSFVPDIFVDKKAMADNWEKYLESLRKFSVK